MSGDLEQVIAGKVSQTIEMLEADMDNIMESPIDEETLTAKKLQEQIKVQQEQSAKMQKQVELMKLRNELEKEKMQQEQWASAMEQLRKAREEVALEHEQVLTRIHSTTTAGPSAGSRDASHWLQQKMSQDSRCPLITSHNDSLASTREEHSEEVENKARLVAELQRQQEELQKQIQDITMGDPRNKEGDMTEVRRQTLLGENQAKTEQELLLEQIRTALGPKEAPKDPNKALL